MTKNGYAAITIMIIVMATSLTIISGFALFTLREVNANHAYIKSIDARFIAEAGIEDVVYRVVKGKQVSSTETLAVGQGNSTITTSLLGTIQTIRSEGLRDTFQQNLETKIDSTTSSVNFSYGVQIGDGGLTIAQDSTIVGNIYSNGNVSGANNVTITGDAFVAVASPPSINQSWETQNADFAVGTFTGGMLSTIESSGNMGTYNSLARGLDGFARISYIDGTNSDLKFVRCTNTDCTTKNITTLDSVGVIDEVTSIAIGTDGFARISYYHDGNDDLKFVQCTNDDCTTRVVIVLESSGNVGDFSAIKMGSDGFARIAYWQDNNGDLKYMRCTNADCSTHVATLVDSSNDVGEYTSLALASDGFGRISYYNRTNGDLKFVQCTNDDCTTKNITTVDSSNDVGLYTSVALGSDGFARIAYLNETNDDLKFVRCTNTDCSTKNILSLDTGGNVGRYASLALGSDGFARISYYDSSNGALKFIACLTNDCDSKTIVTLDTANDTGQYTSLALDGNNFALITYYDNTADDLKFIRCYSDPCGGPNPSVDVAQSFQPTISNPITQIELYIKKVGSPADATMRLIRDNAGSPSTNPLDILSSVTIAASTLTNSYAWINLVLPTNPNLDANTSYWIVIDAVLDNNNYIVWGLDSAAGYNRGSPKRTLDVTTGGWINITGDLNFRAYMGGSFTSLRDVNIGGNANAHTIDNVDVTGNVNAFSYNNGTVTGNINASSISNCTINGNASYNTKTVCTVAGTETTPTTPPADPPWIPMPITDAQIQGWKNDASCGTCTIIAGNHTVSGSEILGPAKIIGNLDFTPNAILTITGTIWVTGTIDISKDSTIKLDPSYGAFSGVLLSDNMVNVKKDSLFQGSGTAGSYVLLLTTQDAPSSTVMDIDKDSAGVIYYAGKGRIHLHKDSIAKEVAGYGIDIDKDSTITYESGLINTQFSSGPSGGFDVTQWKEVP